MINRKKEGLSEHLTGHKKRAEKRLTRFTVMLIPDSADMTRSFELTFDQLAKWLVSAVAVILIIVSLLISSAVKNYKLAYGDGGVKVQLKQLENENAKLAAEKEELSKQIASLSSVLEEKQSAEQQAAQAAEAEAVPTGLPLDGTAVLIQDPNAPEGSEVKGRVVFTAMAGTAVVASGSGTVSSVSTDVNYGNVVVIDHGNGYMTTYRTSASVRVKSGDVVRKNDMLGVMSEDDGLLAYEIEKDGEAIEPLDLMEIAG